VSCVTQYRATGQSTPRCGASWQGMFTIVRHRCDTQCHVPPCLSIQQKDVVTAGRALELLTDIGQAEAHSLWQQDLLRHPWCLLLEIGIAWHLACELLELTLYNGRLHARNAAGLVVACLIAEQLSRTFHQIYREQKLRGLQCKPGDRA